MTTYRRVEVTKRTIRYEFPVPMDMATLGKACSIVAQEYERLHGRMPHYDNDYWLELECAPALRAQHPDLPTEAPEGGFVSVADIET